MDGPLQMPMEPAALRQFVTAQLNWERYHGARVRLIHVSAACALALWLLAVLQAPAPRSVLIGAATCFVATAFAGMMEWRWQRRRDRWVAAEEAK